MSGEGEGRVEKRTSGMDEERIERVKRGEDGK